MQKCKEIRFAEVGASGVNDLTLIGNPIVFEEPTTIHLPDGGSYTEVIHAHALDQCDLSDSTLKVNHNEKMIPLARSGRTMRLEVTNKGLHMVASLAGDNPTAQEVYSAVKRGDLTGMSFAFVVENGGSRYDAQTNTRHIDRIARVLECSIVEHPAYASASVEARAAIEAARDEVRTQAQSKAARVIALAKAKRIITRQIG